MVTDMRPITKQVKSDLLSRLGPKDMIARVVQNYEQRTDLVLNESIGQDPKEYLAKKITTLEAKLLTINHNTHPQKFRDTLSERKVLNTLITNDGKLEAPDISAATTKRSYKDKLKVLRQAGLVIDSTQPHKDLEQIADFELMVLGREYELPQPFSQTMIKNPKKTNTNPEAIFFQYSIQKTFKQKTGFDFRTIRPSNDDDPETHKQKEQFLKFLGKAFAQEGMVLKSNYLLNRSRGFYSYLKQKPHTTKQFKHEITDAIKSYHEAAIAAGKDLPKANYLTIVPNNITITEIVENEWEPIQIYKEALDDANSDSRYIALSFKGQDNSRRIFMLSNAIAGLKGFLFSEHVRKLKKQGYKVKQSDIVDVKPYAGKSEGLVGSKSGIQQQYHTKVGPFANYIGIRKKEHLKKQTKILGSCDCRDNDFIADLHESEAQEPQYFCKHAYMLAATYITQEENAKQSVINPIPFPDRPLVFAQKVLEEQVFVERRTDENLKPLNRGEQEPILISLAIDKPNYITTNVSRSAYAIKQVYDKVLKPLKEPLEIS